jgi:hypothetical protein
MKFAKFVFWCAGIWGIAVLTPLYFILRTVNLQAPPAITHPEFYYGFVGVALAWQFVFILVATDPVRFKPMMILSMLEKFGYAATMVVLYLQMRLGRTQVIAAVPDCILGILFVAAYLKTPKNMRDH